MRMKFWVVSALFASPTLASAQHTKTPTTTPARIAAVSPPPPVVPAVSPVVRRNGFYGGTFYGGAFYGGAFYGGAFYGGAFYGTGRYGPAPLVLLTDGRAFADFGYGYQQVIDPCGSTTYNAQIVSASGANQPVVVQPSIRQPSAEVISNPSLPSPSTMPANNSSTEVSASHPGHPCWSLQSDGRLVAYP